MGQLDSVTRFEGRAPAGGPDDSILTIDATTPGTMAISIIVAKGFASAVEGQFMARRRSLLSGP
jgi:hypothetical protein